MALLRRHVPLTDVSVGRRDSNAPIFELCDNVADSDEPDDDGGEDDDDAEESVFFLLLFAKLLTKIYNTLHYLHYSHYLQPRD